MKTYLLIVSMFAASSNAAVINVPGDYPTIQLAINAGSDGDTILVAPGTYVEDVNFGTLGGIYNLVASGGPFVTSIESPFWSANSVITLAGFTNSGSSIEGFTIKFGVVAGFGGGLHISNSQSDISVIDCVFKSNSATDGGGAFVAEDSTASFVDCIFSNNIASGNGGGLCILANGGFTVDRCRFESNAAAVGGGAMIGKATGLSSGETFPRATNCVFINNAATTVGGGIRVRPAFTGGFPFYSGGVYGCTFYGNSAPFGGAVYGPDLTHQGTVNVVNCILWANDGEYEGDRLGDVTTSWPNFGWCCLDLLGSGVLEDGNTSVNPRLSNADSLDLRLQPGSPCIDAGKVFTGSAADLNGYFDIEGGDRRLECTLVADTGSGSAPIVDIGAYEFNEDEIDGTVAIPDPNGPSGASIAIDEPSDWWDGVLPDDTRPTWLDGDVPMDISVWNTAIIGPTYVNSGDFTFSNTDGSSTAEIAIMVWNGSFLIPENCHVGSFQGEHPSLTLSNVNLMCDELFVEGGVVSFDPGSAEMGPDITANAIYIFSGASLLESTPSSDVALMGTGSLTPLSVLKYDLLYNAGVVQPTGPIEVGGGYWQSPGGLFPLGTLRFDMTSLDQVLIVSGEAALGGAVHFALDPKNPPDLNEGEIVVLLTASDGFTNDTTFDYAITSGFADGKYFTLQHVIEEIGGSYVTGTVVTTEEIVFGEGETDASDLVAASLLADMNGDSYEDLVLSVPSIDSVIILLNQGMSGGTWGGFSGYGTSAAIIIPVGSRPTGIASGDFDDDGKLDLAVANTGDGTVSFLINDGSSPTPGFGIETIDSAPHLDQSSSGGADDRDLAEPLDVYVGDLDNDGYVDLAVTNAFDGSVVAFQNLGNWFGPSGGMGGGDESDPGGTIQKFDPNGAAGKGRDDQVWGSSSSTSTAKTARNAGSGVGPGIFLEWTSYATDLDPVDIGVGDLNDDGDTDVVTVNQSTGTISVLLGAGESGQEAALVFSIGVEPRSVDLGDLDGDGDLDIAVACMDDKSQRVIRIVKNMFEETGVFGLVVQPDDNLLDYQPFLVNIANIDNDGDGGTGSGVADIVALTSSSAFIKGDGGFVSALGEIGRAGSCDEDLTGDGTVDAADLGLVLAGWGTNGTSDINGDGLTDAADLGLILAAWGPCNGEV